MAFNLNSIGKLVKIANGVSNPKQGINMLLGQIEKKDPNMATALRTAINSGKNPAQFIRENANNGVINEQNFNEVKKYYNMAQKMGLSQKVSNSVWNEIEQAIKNKPNGNGFSGF